MWWSREGQQEYRAKEFAFHATLVIAQKKIAFSTLGTEGLLGTEKGRGKVKFTFNQPWPAALGEQPV